MVPPKEDIGRVRKVCKSGSDDKGNAKGIWAQWDPDMASLWARRGGTAGLETAHVNPST
jgi:hypothetical protein